MKEVLSIFITILSFVDTYESGLPQKFPRTAIYHLW